MNNFFYTKPELVMLPEKGPSNVDSAKYLAEAKKTLKNFLMKIVWVVSL